MDADCIAVGGQGMKSDKKPMHTMTPAEHARLGWSWGTYRDGICLTLSFDMAPADLAEFRAQAKADGADVVNLMGMK